MFGLGELPKAYNPKVHGPYDPAIFYGKSKYFSFACLILAFKMISTRLLLFRGQSIWPGQVS
jgi:hypothetical protein